MRLRLLFALAPFALVACGGSDKPKVPEPIAKMQDALRSLHSYHLTGSDHSAQGKISLAADWQAPGLMRMHVTQRGVTADFIITSRGTYLRAGPALWARRAHLPPRVVALVAHRWVAVPLDKDTASLAKNLRPDTLAHCAGFNIGSMRDLGVRRLRGASVRVLEFAGDAPGSAPGRLTLAARGPAYPLRITQTGPTRPGGTRDPLCDSPQNPESGSSADIRMSRFNAPMNIAPPTHPLSMDDIRNQAKRTGTV